MWIVFSIVALMWLLSIHFYFPVPVILGFFAAMLVFGAVATFQPARQEFEE